MAFYALGLRTTGFTASAASLELIAASGTKPQLMEISIWQATATATSCGFGRFAVPGITPVQVSLRAEDSTQPAPQGTASLSWATQPQIPAAYLRRWNSAAAIGQTVIWSFPRGINYGVSASIGLWNVSATVACDVNVIVDE